MSEKKPFIIRNDTPHNVEVVAGSLNAKGKKSWVKANDEDHEKHNVGEQHLDLDQHLENLLSSEKEAADSSPVITHAIEDSQTSLSKEGVNDRNQKLDLGPKAAENLQSIPAPGNSAPRLEAVDEGSIHDRSQVLPNGATKDRTNSLLHQAPSTANDVKINQDTIKDNLQKLGTSQVEDNLQKVGGSQSLDNKAKLEASKVGQNVQSLQQDQASDNKVKLDLAQDGKNVQTLGQDQVEDNKVKLPGLKPSANVQEGFGVQGSVSNQGPVTGLSIDANHQSVGEQALGQNKQSIPAQHHQYHSVAIDNKGSDLNTQALPGDESTQNTAQIDGTVYDLKHQEKAYSEKIEDNVASIPSEVSKDHQVSIDSDKVSDQFAKLPTSTSSDHEVGLPSDAPLEDNRAKIEGTSIADRRAKFEEIRRQRNAPQLNPSVAVPVLEEPNPKTASSASSAKANKPLTRDEQITLARKKKSDEFHGRVEAIKNTVTQLNNQLDKLEDTSVELKKTRF
jgi:hypothetical protein